MIDSLILLIPRLLNAAKKAKTFDDEYIITAKALIFGRAIVFGRIRRAPIVVHNRDDYSTPVPGLMEWAPDFR